MSATGLPPPHRAPRSRGSTGRYRCPAAPGTPRKRASFTSSMAGHALASITPENEVELLGAAVTGAIKRALAPDFKPVHENALWIAREHAPVERPSFAQYRRGGNPLRGAYSSVRRSFRSSRARIFHSGIAAALRRYGNTFLTLSGRQKVWLRIIWHNCGGVPA